MFKLRALQTWATTARQLSTTSTSTILRVAPSNPALPTRAFAKPTFACYSTESSGDGDDPDEPAPKPWEIPVTNPWKEWIRPNKRAQARYELYGKELWYETQRGKEKGMEDQLEADRVRKRENLRRKLGDAYDAVIAETKREAYERYATKEWRKEIDRTKKELIKADDGRREKGLLHIELPESSRNSVKD